MSLIPIESVIKEANIKLLKILQKNLPETTWEDIMDDETFVRDGEYGGYLAGYLSALDAFVDGMDLSKETNGWNI
jgi:hypothetical protein